MELSKRKKLTINILLSLTVNTLSGRRNCCIVSRTSSVEVLLHPFKVLRRTKVQLMQVNKRQTINPLPLGHFCLSQLHQVVYSLCISPFTLLVVLSECQQAAPQLPQLQDAGDVPCGENPPHIVEIAHVQTSI